MCGIAVGLSEDETLAGLIAIAHRGPDNMAVFEPADPDQYLILGHVRLSILDPDPRSDCPLTHGATTIVYNGEMWNYEEIRRQLEGEGAVFVTSGDTEVVAAALDRWGIDALNAFDGMFAVVWETDGRVYAARDRFGEVPLHIDSEGRAASELKALTAMGSRSVQWLPPGSWIELGTLRIHRYYQTPLTPVTDDLDEAAAKVGDLLDRGSQQRTISDVPVCTLLSGGIDSSAIALSVQKRIPGLVAYTAVYDPKARDLRTARIVAEALGMDLVEVKVPVPTADDLARVVSVIEMPHKAQVEIGWPCLKLAEAMQGDGFKVTFTGEGSDELWASYGFSYHGLKKQDWHSYRRDVFVGQHRKNFARANKAFLAYGVEARLPFLHPPLVEYAVSLNRAAVREGSRPKAVLERAYAGLLPDEVIKRPKVAFQDGMGIKSAIAGVVSDPTRFYRSMFADEYGSIAKP